MFEVADAPQAVKSATLSYPKCRFQDSADAIEDALQHSECGFDGFSEGVAPTHEEEAHSVPTLNEHVAPTQDEPAKATTHESRKRSLADVAEGEDEEGCVAPECKASKIDVLEEGIEAYSEIYAEDDEFDKAHTEACCRLLNLVNNGPKPGMQSHFVCQHGEFPPGSTCECCVGEAEQRAIAAFSGRFDFGHEVNGQMAVVWANSALCSKSIDLITTDSHEHVRTVIDVCYSGARYSFRNIAFNTNLFWSAVFLFLETGTSGHERLDESLDKAFSAARDEE